MALRTSLTERLGIRHPILLAPMGGSAGGALAAAVSAAGGLGLIGGGGSTGGQGLARLFTGTGDDTLHTRDFEIARNHRWPAL